MNTEYNTEMPELAEVALYARDLNQITKGQKVLSVAFPNQNDWGSTIIPAPLKKRLKSIVNQSVYFESAGKGLYLFCKNDQRPLVEFRLGMTGSFQLIKQLGSWKRHYFLSIKVGSQTIHYADPRRFGRVSVPEISQQSIGGYNLEQGFWKQRKIILPNGYLKQPRITWLLSNGDKTGIGNYMANEALGSLQLSPFTPCENEHEAIAILKKCRDIAAMSFRYNGNSFGNGYFLLNGDEGGYGKFCRFYRNPDIRKCLFKGRPVFSNL